MSDQLTIGASGRVVIPKRFRDRLRLRAGDRLEIHVDGNTLVLKPMRQTEPLGEEHGIRVYRGDPRRPVDTDSLLGRLRQKRIEDLIG